MASETRGYTATKDQLKSRLRRRVEVRCGLLDGHARTCVIGAEPDKQADRTEELMSAVGRLMRRG
jgi:hypothetical protein